MTDPRANTAPAADGGIADTPADLVTDPSMVPMDDAAGGPTADKDEQEPSDEEAAAQLGDFA